MPQSCSHHRSRPHLLPRHIDFPTVYSRTKRSQRSTARDASSRPSSTSSQLDHRRLQRHRLRLRDGFTVLVPARTIRQRCPPGGSRRFVCALLDAGHRRSGRFGLACCRFRTDLCRVNAMIELCRHRVLQSAGQEGKLYQGVDNIETRIGKTERLRSCHIRACVLSTSCNQPRTVSE